MAKEEPCELLTWDSEFFGHKIARVREHRLSEKLLREVLRWCGKHAVEYLYFLSDADDPQTVRLMEDNGFRLVDIRVTLQCRISIVASQGQEHASDAPSIRPARSEDIVALQEIAGASHKGTRFYSDPQFPADLCKAFYETWIKKSYEGYVDTVFVAEADGRPVGYISCHASRETKKGRIGLVGVHSKASGQGIGYALVKHSLRWFAQKGAKAVTVVTQGHNTVAQRLYQRCGFVTSSLHLWYHKWMSDFASTGRK